VSGGAAATGIVGLDVASVSDWLANCGLDLTAPYEFAPVGQGRSNLTFVVTDAAGRSVVLRRPPLGELLASAHDIGREVAFLTLLSTAGHRVPSVLARCDDLAVTGAPFYLMDRIDGVVLESEAVVERELDLSARAATGPALARTLAQLHTADFEDDAFRDVITTDGTAHASRQIHRWTSQWARSKPYEVPLVDELGLRLAAAIPTQREVTIVHGDYALHNAVFSKQGELRAVLDWEMATLGDPQSDLAWLLMLWPERTEDIVAGPEPLSLMAGFGPRSRLVETYVSASGREPDALPFWLALSYWKLTIAIAGIYRRWQGDPANGGTDAQALGAQVKPLASVAARVADQAGL
jgi:aminoglycoside phosphotransferase (APT) family kinase protein